MGLDLSHYGELIAPALLPLPSARLAVQLNPSPHQTHVISHCILQGSCASFGCSGCCAC